ncbi:protein rep [Flavobacterium sp. DG1-102-2]|uniref:protein rep n=1 Tax=Flavobacterium sp. DG1-102-2 TaxID=3081663 RepID=UPI00294A3F46|nr:protein rep [Flavobacterium sp. DG1-102-2]MDV6169685.1 protein rep [Flavobacterium sp. DG1-102-2]
MTKREKKNLGGSIITLGQNGTTLNHKCEIVTGKGSNLTTSNLKLRAKRKQANQNIALNLVDLAKAKGDSYKQKLNWNIYYCQNTITTSNGRLYSKYCKNRNCEICQNIRRAEIINKYIPIIKTWTQPHLITLTIKSCEEHELKGRIQEMFDIFKRIKDKHRKRSLRGKGFELIGVKSLECGFDLNRERYNPHFHLMVENKQIGDSLISEWLEIWTLSTSTT